MTIYKKNEINAEKQAAGFVGSVVISIEDIWENPRLVEGFKRAFETGENIELEGVRYKIGAADVSYESILFGLLPPNP